MTPAIYLIAPPDAVPDMVERALTTALAHGSVAALLLPRGQRAERDYRNFVTAVAGKAQAAGAAVLIEGEPGLVRTLKVDGLHVPGGIGAVREAIAALKPDFIVGAGDLRSRDDAMLKGEAGVDYVLFGPLSGPITAAERELARWWAETMEIPGILSDPEASLAAFDAEGLEFVGLSAGRMEPAR